MESTFLTMECLILVSYAMYTMPYTSYMSLRVCLCVQRTAGVRGVNDDRHSEKKVNVFDYSARVSAHRPMQDYSLWHCLGYVFYAPLYLAGPTITYNAYVSHVGTLNNL